jgi:ribosome-binding protein aMBF1 (putative translation factor)
MAVQSLVVGGRRFAVIEWSEYERLARHAARRTAEARTTPEVLPLPEPDAQGHVPAVEYARASLARKLALARRAAGLSQAELAQRAGVRAETISRLEHGKHTPDARTFALIEKALATAGVRHAPGGRRPNQRAG